MRILILGGTRFLGRHLVEAALAKGHHVTLFHRGQTGADLFEGRVERILGDRTQDLSALEGRDWDAVIDTCGYIPRVVGLSAEALAQGRPNLRYAFVSSISVYDGPPAGADETWKVGTIEDPSTEEINGDTYGPLKALCEQEVRGAFGDSALIVRPGLIVGPHDPTDRFTYWPDRIARGGDVLVPARPDQPVQIIDVRDLAAWCVGALEQGLSGDFNLAAPETPYRLGELLERLRKEINPNATLHPVSPEKLQEWGVPHWIELPMYLGPNVEDDGAMAVSIRRALDTGLTIRSLEETARDTLAWSQTRPADHIWRGGLTPERERELLGLWWS